ncbi:hypothetical protein H5410_053524 [Solanum commersonii]|uniref:Uncharacterized protein n=1 Tax=Solanum commersonii TaxID=4109 RepID=A0A9J5X3Q7_SOLCO|nr:hypothetical protein H5410_053524 [Solanum commersonii]
MAIINNEAIICVDTPIMSLLGNIISIIMLIQTHMMYRLINMSTLLDNLGMAIINNEATIRVDAPTISLLDNIISMIMLIQTHMMHRLLNLSTLLDNLGMAIINNKVIIHVDAPISSLLGNMISMIIRPNYQPSRQYDVNDYVNPNAYDASFAQYEYTTRHFGNGNHQQRGYNSRPNYQPSRILEFLNSRVLEFLNS